MKMCGALFTVPIRRADERLRKIRVYKILLVIGYDMCYNRR